MESHTILNTPALNTLIGEQIQGKWMLAVSDLSTMDVGELANWGIKYACESNL